MSELLSAGNFGSGFLVDAERIGGVTESTPGTFVAWVSHQLTGETYEYREFSALHEALVFLNAYSPEWAFEAIGCGTGKKTCGNGACGTGGCGTGKCGSS